MDNSNNIALQLSKRQHIQDHSAANTPYWGYASRVLPCTKDAGTCAYLDAVYGMHVTSMTYTFILWGVILSILVLWSSFRIYRTNNPSSQIINKLSKWKTRYLLPDAPFPSLFGRITRTQFALLTAGLIYLLIFSLVGIVYKTWITPISNSPLHNTRTGLGGWSDRLGALAYALTPFSLLLCQRESLLSLLTGIPHQHFNFLHRWLGRVIFVQSFLHTLGWTLIEGKFYQPQPLVYKNFMAQQYVIFGVVAMALITFLTVFSTQWAIRKTGYEVFKAAHWISAVGYIAACWGHWDKLWCWMVPSLALIVFDQGVRFARTVGIHRNGNRHSQGFHSAMAKIQVLQDGHGAVVRLDFDLEHTRPWGAGQHFYLTFPGLSVWESHPFTVASAPDPTSRLQHHTYILRVRDGQTKKLAGLGEGASIETILTGPYGQGFPTYESQHLLAVAGGTGVTFTLPIVLEAVGQFTNQRAVVDFVWVVRGKGDVMWLGKELGRLKGLLEQARGLRIVIYVTRENGSGGGKKEGRAEEEEEKKGGAGSEEGVSLSSATADDWDDDDDDDWDDEKVSLGTLLGHQTPRFRINFLKDHHPSMEEIVGDFQERVGSAGVGGLAEIVGSGPEAMGSDLRAAVASAAAGAGIGEQEIMRLYWDSRE